MWILINLSSLVICSLALGVTIAEGSVAGSIFNFVFASLNAMIVTAWIAKRAD